MTEKSSLKSNPLTYMRFCGSLRFELGVRDQPPGAFWDNPLCQGGEDFPRPGAPWDCLGRRPVEKLENPTGFCVWRKARSCGMSSALQISCLSDLDYTSMSVIVHR
jgi:hypothetical protein